MYCPAGTAVEVVPTPRAAFEQVFAQYAGHHTCAAGRHPTGGLLKRRLAAAEANAQPPRGRATRPMREPVDHGRARDCGTGRGRVFVVLDRVHGVPACQDRPRTPGQPTPRVVRLAPSRAPREGMWPLGGPTLGLTTATAGNVTGTTTAADLAERALAHAESASPTPILAPGVYHGRPETGVDRNSSCVPVRS